MKFAWIEIDEAVLLCCFASMFPCKGLLFALPSAIRHFIHVHSATPTLSPLFGSFVSPLHSTKRSAADLCGQRFAHAQRRFGAKQVQLTRWNAELQKWTWVMYRGVWNESCSKQKDETMLMDRKQRICRSNSIWPWFCFIRAEYLQNLLDRRRKPLNRETIYRILLESKVKISTIASGMSLPND